MSEQKTKKILKGDLLFYEGGKAESIYLIQTGRISYFLKRGNTKLEVYSVGATQVAGIWGAFGLPKHPYSAEAQMNTNLIEMPLEAIKNQIEGSNNIQKIMLKSLAEEVKVAAGEVRTLKLTKDPNCCPQIFIPRLFGSINFILRHIGKKSEKGIEIPWATMRMYVVRVFMEATARMEGILQILQKLKIATIVTKKNEDDEDEWDTIILHDLNLIENFSEFYQYNMYKPRRAEIMYVDPFIYPKLKAMVEYTKTQQPNHKGAVKLHFQTLEKNMRDDYKNILKLDHLAFFENKGLFLERKSEDDGVYWYFNKEEFANTFHFWRIIREIDRWNELGQVDFKELAEYYDDLSGPAKAESQCPSCGGDIQLNQRFCPNCGAKLLEK